MKRLYSFLLMLCALLVLGPRAQAGDFAVQLTNGDIFDTGINNFGVKVADDGTYTATAADDATATFTVSSARFNDAQHGWVNCTFTIPVSGPVKIGLGNCQYGSQDGTITDAAGNVTSLTVGKANCWAASDIAGTTSYTIYKGTAATTLTVKYNGYCPYISVQAVSAADLKDDATVTFAAGEAGDAPVPAAIKEEVGKQITLPTNFTLYVEGKTLTGWSDGTKTYAPGAAYTVPEADVTLTAVFTANEVSLADRTEPVSLKFDFMRQDGAPTVAWEGKTGLVWVTQATVNGKTIDVKADVSTSPGKFANGNWNDWAQLNNGTKFTIPSAKGAVVTIESYSATTTTTIDGQTDYTASGNVVTYNIANTAATIDIVIGDGSYFRYIKVDLPVAAKPFVPVTFEGEDGTIAWKVGNEATPAVSANLDGAFSTTVVSTGSELKVASATYFESTMVKYTPVESNAGNVEGVMIEYRVKPTAGLTFTPQSVSYDCVKVGTDGATYSYGYVIGETPSAITTVDAATTLRNNGANSATASLNHTIYIEGQATNDFAFRFYISNTANNKDICIGNVVISGTVDGTTINVPSYAVATASNIAEGGSTSIYPRGDEFDEGTELVLTATRNFGYKFLNWTDADGEVVSTDAKFTLVVDADAVLTANFEAINTYELKYAVDGGANLYQVQPVPAPTVVGGKNMYEEGTEVTLTASSNAILTFTNWSSGETSSELKLILDKDYDLTASYSSIDYIVAWDFYRAGSSGRVADFYSTNDNEATQLVLTDADGNTSGWLDKSTEAAGGYESLAGAAVNWRTTGLGKFYYQTKVNAKDFTGIGIKSQLLYNYNAYTHIYLEWSTNGTEWNIAVDDTIPAAKVVKDFNAELPAAADHAETLYIRWRPDTDGPKDGTSSDNDGTTIGNIYILGQAAIYDDGTAPALVSTVPAEGATGASANGRVVLTFDEKVKLTDDAAAELSGEALTLKVSGKTVIADYKALSYATDYTFSLAAGSVADLAGNTLGEAVTIHFTTMNKPTVQKALYDFVVPDDGTFSAALAAAAAREDNSKRFRIFVKQGSYVIPANDAAPVTGNDGKSYGDPKTSFGSPNVSIIGEDRELTSIANTMPGDLSQNSDAGAGGMANPLEGIRTSGLLYLTSGAKNTYFQDITLKTNTADNTGRNVILVDGSDKTICKNVCLWAYQDTYVSDNTQATFYFEGGLLRGRTDFLCGGGNVYYNGVTLQMCEQGGYIAVPRDNTKYGYVFKDCVIRGETDAVNGKYYLGRPWTAGAEAYYIDTKMEAIPAAVGWAEMSGNACTQFAEWNSVSASGNAIDLSGRASVIGGQPNQPRLTEAEADEIGKLANTFGDWDPTLLTEQAPAPVDVKLNKTTKQIWWENSNYALLWAIVKDGKVVAFTVEPKYDVDDVEATWSVRAANEMGGLSEAVEAVVTTDGIETVQAEVDRTGVVYDLRGRRVSGEGHGLFIVNGKKVLK